MAWPSVALVCLISSLALPCFARNLVKESYNAQRQDHAMANAKPEITWERWEKVVSDAQNQVPPMVLNDKPEITWERWEKVIPDAQNQLAPPMVNDKPTTSSTSENLVKEFLDSHNQARAKVNVKPLTWDKQVAAYAQGYANQRIGDCGLVHSGGSYGENIAMSTGDLSATDAVKMWVDEKVYYNYQSNTCASNQICGHYTQVVWGDSVHVGCAKVKCDNGGTFITCNYDPPGNYNGQKPF
ncbi:Allergen V5/Tpx-1-related protein [Corchorus olitorius]|uniref:Pathogenesis-related protein 1 n=1 Tax=Corchorus olitorius TaxID=93759 RepID=A0A1R3JBI3_9ROSI|nr:Allergen V5/Tpx-1-related protein [Corchorus olitorius]